jgi:hypothetical protein
MIAFRKYVNLCSEEYFLFRSKKIDSETWGIWKSGMDISFQSPLFRDCWGKISGEYHNFPEFTSLIEKLQINDTAV